MADLVDGVVVNGGVLLASDPAGQHVDRSASMAAATHLQQHKIRNTIFPKDGTISHKIRSRMTKM